MCTSFKREALVGLHNFAAAGGHSFKIALFDASVVLNETTTAYSTTGEVAYANYTAGGFALTKVDPSISGTVAMVTFAVNPLWIAVTFAATQALIYNASSGNKAVAVLDFGGVQLVTAGNFGITLPAVTSTTALLRIV